MHIPQYLSSQCLYQSKAAQTNYYDSFNSSLSYTHTIYAYILKDDIGKFYAGHTRDLRIRYGYHTDGKVKSTAGRDQKLKYFETFNSRQSAASREMELKTLIQTNEFKVRKMILDFEDEHKY
ncbi:GIY-YIG nuclease family protein [Chloroflexota bacterium]